MAGLVIGHIGVAKLQVVEVHLVMAKVRASMPGAHRQIDKAMTGNMKCLDGGWIGASGWSWGGYSQPPVFAL